MVIPAVLILATAAVGLVLLLAKGGSGPSASRTPGGPSRTPSAPHVSATIEVGKDPNGIAFGNGSVWVANFSSNTVSRIDPATNQVTDTISAGRSPFGITFGAGSVWVTSEGSNFEGNTVSRIDPATGRVTATITVGTNPSGIAFGDGSVWVANVGKTFKGDTVSRIDATPLCHRIRQRRRLGDQRGQGVSHRPGHQHR